MTREIERTMVTGAAGQIGSELTLALRKKYGNDNVLATDIKIEISPKLSDSGPFECVNVVDRETIQSAVKNYKIDTIFHMSAIASASGETRPHLAWNVNLNGTFNILEAAREHNMV